MVKYRSNFYADYFNLLVRGCDQCGSHSSRGGHNALGWIAKKSLLISVGCVLRLRLLLLTGEHMPWDRKSGTLARIKPFQNFWLVDRCNGGRSAGWGAWQLAARWSHADYTDEDIFGGVGDPSFRTGTEPECSDAVQLHRW